MTDVDRWLGAHHSELHDLARYAATTDDTVEMVAELVLAGSTDEEIYDELRVVLPSLDHQRNPLEGAPDLIFELRRLVATS